MKEALHQNPPLNLLLEARKVYYRLKNLLEKDNKILKNNLNHTLVINNSQALRFFFLKTPPLEYIYNTNMLIRLCITNEFGLWDRSQLISKITNDYIYLKVKCNMKLLLINSNIINIIESDYKKEFIVGADGKVYIYIYNIYIFYIYIF